MTVRDNDKLTIKKLRLQMEKMQMKNQTLAEQLKEQCQLNEKIINNHGYLSTTNDLLSTNLDKVKCTLKVTKEKSRDKFEKLKEVTQKKMKNMEIQKRSLEKVVENEIRDVVSHSLANVADFRQEVNEYIRARSDQERAQHWHIDQLHYTVIFTAYSFVFAFFTELLTSSTGAYYSFYRALKLSLLIALATAIITPFIILLANMYLRKYHERKAPITAPKEIPTLEKDLSFLSTSEGIPIQVAVKVKAPMNRKPACGFNPDTYLLS